MGMRGKRREQKSSGVRFGVFGEGGRWTVGTLHCQARFYVPEFFWLSAVLGVDLCEWSVFLKEKNFGFSIDLHGEDCGFITLK